MPRTGYQPEFERRAQELDGYLAHMVELAPGLPRDAGNDKLIPELKACPASSPTTRNWTAGTTHGGTRALRQGARRSCRRSGRRRRYSERSQGGRGRAGTTSVRMSRGRCCGPGGNYATPRSCPILQAARDIYDGLRRERGQLNFQDLLMKAAALLRENPARPALLPGPLHPPAGGRVPGHRPDPGRGDPAALIATDPDETDWRACRPRPGSLFVVGDPKQSIYRFRRADIVTYNEVKKIIRAGGGMVVDLSRPTSAPPPPSSPGSTGSSSRASPHATRPGEALLRFPAEDTEESPRYVPLLPGERGGRGRRTLRSLPPTHPGEVSNKETATEYEADLIARFIRAALDNGHHRARAPASSWSEGIGAGGRPVRFHDRHAQQPASSAPTQALQDYGIPHQVTGGTALNELEELRLLHDLPATRWCIPTTRWPW